jgi:hypothetical protein
VSFQVTGLRLYGNAPSLKAAETAFKPSRRTRKPGKRVKLEPPENWCGSS